MRSTFMGLETSKRGLYTQQSALYTTGHNISNANTLGYSRQRINMEATLGYPGPGLNAPKTAGHIGTGVQAHSVQRIRDQFIDRQFRQESNQLGYWDAKSQALTQMEEVMEEPSKYGLNESLDQFWKSLGDLATSPQDSGTRRVVTERGVTTAESFNYIYKQLVEIQGNLKNEIDVSTKDVNSILKQIALLNENISKVEPNGHMPNDLYDARDVLIDELSHYIPIEVSYVKSGGNALAIAEGTVTISLKTAKGPIEIVKGKEASQFEHNLVPGNNNDPFQNFTIKGAPTNGVMVDFAELLPNQGKMMSLITSYGYGNAGEGDYPKMLEDLDTMARAFAEEFNARHRQGFEFNSDVPGEDFFVIKPPGTVLGAGNIAVNEDIIKDPNKIAASDKEFEEGNGQNAISLGGVKKDPINGRPGPPPTTSLGGATVQSFYTGLIGKLGVAGEQAIRLAETSSVKQLTIERSRAAVSSVSLDEEMTNMIMFQQAYNASARMITVVDETLDKIINGMGRVGL